MIRRQRPLDKPGLQLTQAGWADYCAATWDRGGQSVELGLCRATASMEREEKRGLIVGRERRRETGVVEVLDREAGF